MSHCIKLEQEEPTTNNEHYLSDYKNKYLVRYRSKCRSISRSSSAPNATMRAFIDGSLHNNANTMSNAISHLSQLGFQGLDKQTLLRLLPANVDDAALEIMAEVRAYYQGAFRLSLSRFHESDSRIRFEITVAFKRFVDYLPMIIDLELLKNFSRTVQGALLAGLALGDSDAKERCEGLLEEDPDVRQKRDALLNKSKILQRARIELQKVWIIRSLSTYPDESVFSYLCTDFGNYRC